MQIRKQLRQQAIAITKLITGNTEKPSDWQPCCWAQKCPSGYHGVHQRLRWKSRARHHGNSTGQSKGGQ